MNILCFNSNISTITNNIKDVSGTANIAALTDFGIFKGTSEGGGNYATLERDKWRLDGSCSLIDAQKSTMGFWSSAISNDNYNSNMKGYELSSWQRIDFDFDEYMSKNDIDGVTLIFNEGDYSSNFQVQLYNNSKLQKSYTVLNTSSIVTISFSDFPEIETADSSDTNYSVGRFNKVRLYFMASNKPNRFIKLANVRFGFATILDDNSFYDLNLLEEVSISSEQIPANTLKFSIDASKSEADNLKSKRYLELYKDSGPMGSFYLTDISQQGVESHRYNIESRDIIGELAELEYNGVFISTQNGYPVPDIIDKILYGTETKYVIDSSLNDYTASIQFSNLSKREALSHVLFSTNAVCLKKRDGSVWFGKLNTTPIKDITNNLFTGYSINENNAISEFSMSTYQATGGAEIDSDVLKNQTLTVLRRYKDYLLLELTLPELVDVSTLMININFMIVFSGLSYFKNGTYGEDSYGIEFGIHNHEKVYDTSKYLPDKIQFTPNSVIFRIDRETVNPIDLAGASDVYEYRIITNGSNKYWGIERMQYGLGGKNLLTALSEMDFTTADVIRMGFMFQKALGLTISQTQDESAISNPNGNGISNSASVSTIEIDKLLKGQELILGSMEETSGSGEITTIHINKIIEEQMNRFYRYNKHLTATILADGLKCGDTVSVYLPDIGTVSGTIIQLEFNLQNKLIANADILLYTEGE